MDNELKELEKIYWWWNEVIEETDQERIIKAAYNKWKAIEFRRQRDTQ